MPNFSLQCYTTLNKFLPTPTSTPTPLHPTIETKSSQPYSPTQGRFSIYPMIISPVHVYKDVYGFILLL